VTRLWHYTCAHSIRHILAARGTLKPNPAPGWQKKVRSYVYPVVWATDVDIRSRADAMLVGLAQIAGNMTDCHRTDYRFIVPRVGVVPWAEWAEDNADPEIRKLLEAAPGADPERWFVSPAPIAGARLDERYPGVRW
jgi:hypothetical protein